MMGGSRAHEYIVFSEVGEDTIALCERCGYTANRQVAAFARPKGGGAPEPLDKVATPGASTIAGVAQFLGIEESGTAKAFFVTASVRRDGEDTDVLVLAIVRGDMEVNETKLANVVGARELRPATDEEILAVGAVPGYASPIGLASGSGLLVVVDQTAADTANLVGGANEEGHHFTNTCCGRDYEPDLVADIVAVEDGYACPHCGGALRMQRGVEVGNIFKLGTRYSESLGCHYQDEQGNSKPVVMGSYGIGVGRALACVAEVHNDAHGLVWPITVAPYDVHLVALRGVEAEAASLYDELRSAGVEVLVDDRDERPGVKFNDADLIGIPIRITLGTRSLAAGGAEVKLRRSEEGEMVAASEIVGHVSETRKALYRELEPPDAIAGG
jgi:prolyl-tRNA synthetase